MPGPQDPSDQAAGEYGRGHDTPRPPNLDDGPADRPARGSLTDFRQRLDRLPPGHPSSPYHDDGSRKPAVVRLKDLELPLPGDTGTAESEPRQAEADLEEAGLPEADPADAGQADADPADAGQAQADQAESDQAQADQADADPADAGQAAASLPAYLAENDRARSDQDRTYGGRHAGGNRAGLPHEVDARRDATDRVPGSPAGTLADVAIDPPQTRPDGSWEWKGSHLSAGECKIADETLSRCQAAEGRTVFGTYKDSGLTPAMRRVEAQLEHGHLVPETEKFALKSADRFKEKLAKLITRNPDKSSDELAKEVHDNIRYTYLFDDEHYFEAIWQAHSALEDHGYELEVRRNSWDNPEYKGVNTRWRDREHDLRFEVQFHTPSSWDAKQRTHGAYERIADPRTPPRERARLRSEQAEVSATIPIPPRCSEIEDYRQEGL